MTAATRKPAAKQQAPVVGITRNNPIGAQDFTGEFIVDRWYDLKFQGKLIDDGEGNMIENPEDKGKHFPAKVVDLLYFEEEEGAELQEAVELMGPKGGVFTRLESQIALYGGRYLRRSDVDTQ